tara:strand:- start:20 stop:1117 length:1098 start_codon:yes stop_codon:yes gene_type:complete
MVALRIKDLSKSFGSTEVLKKINLEIEEGSFIVLLGPSGCGKSTLLNIIAGLESIDEGSVLIDDYDVSKVEPKDRNIAMVFQSYALYPSMTVKENIIFGLKQAKVSKNKIDEQLQKVSTFLKVDELLNRKPSQLSGGQRQRTAMGRALVREPRIFLFDEPLSNLDAKLRVEMRHEIKKLYTSLKTTMVYVTHDQVEAMSLASKIAVMNEGIIQQLDEPQKIYDKPNSLFVADFIGSPSMNFIKGTISKESNSIIFKPNNESDINFDLSNYEFKRTIEDGHKVIMGLRPEYVSNIEDNSKNLKHLSLKPVIIETTGFDKNVTFDFAGTEIIGRFTPNSGVELNKNHSVYLNLSQLSIFDEKSELRL